MASLVAVGLGESAWWVFVLPGAVAVGAADAVLVLTVAVQVYDAFDGLEVVDAVGSVAL